MTCLFLPLLGIIVKPKLFLTDVFEIRLGWSSKTIIAGETLMGRL